MARRTKKSLKETKLAVKVEAFTIDGLLDHYVRLRFQYWDGSDRVTGALKFFVFENLPSDTKNKPDTRISHKFKTEEAALAFLAEVQTKTKETILESALEALDGDATEASAGNDRTLRKRPDKAGSAN